MSIFDRIQSIGERANHLTGPELCGLAAAFAMFLYTWSLNWGWGIPSFLVTVLLMVVAFLYGKVIARLIVETQWLSKGESMLSKPVIIWGWLGVATGAYLFYTSMFDAPLYIRMLNFMLGSGVVWIGPLFPMMVLGLKNEPDAPVQTEQE